MSRKLKGHGPRITATYTNRALIAKNRFKVSKDWRIEGNRLVSSVGEEIVFYPGKKRGRT